MTSHDPTQPQPPPWHPSQGWGTPPPPRPPRRRRTGLIVALAALGVILALAGVGAVVNTAATSTQRRAAPARTASSVTECRDGQAYSSGARVEQLDYACPQEPTGGPAATEEPAPEPDKPPVVATGDTLTMSDGFGATLAEITVGGPTHPSRHEGVRFSTGDEYDKPKHGLYLGVWVKVVAKADGVDTYGDFHVAQGGHHYSGDACCPEGFEPTLDYATLSKGERAEGWVVFDVRSRHGEVVIADYDGKRLGAWTF